VTRPEPSQWIVAQIGARQHYTVPLGFHRLGLLHSVYTDLWVGRSSTFLRGLGSKAKRLAGRSRADLPNARVVAFNFSSLLAAMTNPVSSSIEDRYQGYIRKGKAFALAVKEHLVPRLNRVGPYTYFGFTTGALETLHALRDRGIRTVVDQIDPARVEEDIVREEMERWPNWQSLPGRIPESYFQRLEEEWALADVVLVNSHWSRDALQRQGVPASKIAIAPLAYEGTAATRNFRRGDSPSHRWQPLRVLWLGHVNLRKGIPYLVEAARLLKGQNVHFHVVGPIEITSHALSTAPDNLVFAGPLPRIDAQQAYAHADVFVLPTLSDGFGLAQLEALAAGLPVITTPNCGSVVTHGKDGYIIPIRDPIALAEAVGSFERDRDLLRAMSENATKSAARFGVDEVARLRLAALHEKMPSASLVGRNIDVS
jgi:glycosyltransferase involved in cell wall biosynthesis